MILFIWSIYILVSGKLLISKTYGVKGGIARLIGAFYLIVSLGLVGALIPIPIEDPIQNMLVSFGIQVFLIIIAPLVAVSIHGNDFAKEDARS